MGDAMRVTLPSLCTQRLFKIQSLEGSLSSLNWGFNDQYLHVNEMKKIVKPKVTVRAIVRSFSTK